MKVGVDSVLLGAWADTTGKQRILDIGTGTGLLALMAAQRTETAVIDAVEIDGEACLQAQQNISGSPWTKRIRVICDDFGNFAANCTDFYDLIITNPPFFTASLKSSDEKRSIARHNDHLHYSDIVKEAKKLLTVGGLLAMVLPPREASLLVEVARHEGLHVRRELKVQSRSDKPVYRNFIELSDTECLPEEETLCIEMAGKEDFTEEYKNLTRDFYLKF